MSGSLTNGFLLGYVPCQKKSEKTKRSKKTEAWIHINLWEEKEKRQDAKIIIDFGIMIKNIGKIKSINIYSPYLIETVTDIADLLKGRQKLIYAVFPGSYVDDKPEECVITPRMGDPFALQNIKPSII